MESCQVIKTLRFSQETLLRANSLHSNDDYRITNKGIWTVNTMMHQYPGGPTFDGGWAGPSEKTRDGKPSAHVDFFQFPTDSKDDDIITTVHTRPMKETSTPSRLLVLLDGSVCVFSILKDSDDVEVTVVHPRSLVHTKSKAKSTLN